MLTPYLDRRLSVGDEPIDREAAKKSLRWTTSLEDELIDGYIETARALFEEQTGGQLINTTWEYSRSAVPACDYVTLPRPPLYGDVVITYDDADGVAQTFDAANYEVEGSFLTVGSPAVPVIETYCRPGRVVLAEGASWPTISGRPNSFRIQRTCGYGTSADAIPGVIKSALYLLVGHFHRNRSEVQAGWKSFDTLPMGAQPILNTFKYLWLLLPEPTLAGITTGRMSC